MNQFKEKKKKKEGHVKRLIALFLSLFFATTTMIWFRKFYEENVLTYYKGLLLTTKKRYGNDLLTWEWENNNSSIKEIDHDDDVSSLQFTLNEKRSPLRRAHTHTHKHTSTQSNAHDYWTPKIQRFFIKQHFAKTKLHSLFCRSFLGIRVAAAASSTGCRLCRRMLVDKVILPPSPVTPFPSYSSRVINGSDVAEILRWTFFEALPV